MFLKAHPYSYRMRTSRIDYEQDAVRQAHIAVNSMIRDQVKGEVTAIERKICSFEEVFLAHMLTADGRREIEIERVQELLPKPTDSKVVSLPKPRCMTAANRAGLRPPHCASLRHDAPTQAVPHRIEALEGKRRTAHHDRGPKARTCR
jgi:hypothetical protein